MSKSEQINVSLRIEKDLKENATNMLNDMGFTMTIAVSVFLQQIVRLKKMPFSVTSNAIETRKPELITTTVRLDAKLKEDATNVLKGLGLTLSSAVQLFFRQTVLCKKIPFEISVENHIES